MPRGIDQLATKSIKKTLGSQRFALKTLLPVQGMGSLALQGKKAAPRFELGVKDLQSSALPLGHAAIREQTPC